jgi:hypothetical protein
MALAPRQAVPPLKGLPSVVFRAASKRLGSYILYPISYILYPISYILYPISYILYPISCAHGAFRLRRPLSLHRMNGPGSPLPPLLHGDRA